MRAVIIIVGRDSVGILARASAICAKYNANIIDVTQTVMGDLFSMVMLAEIDNLNCGFSVFRDEMVASIEEMGLKSYVMHEDIFNSMHRI